MPRSIPERAALSDVLAVLAGMCCVLATTPDDARRTVITIVTQIQRADYEGDRAALRRLRDELSPFVDVPAIASRVRYWRGFALWRRAFNGFNGPMMNKAEIDADLMQAAADMHDAATRDPAFVDAKIGDASCLVNAAALNMTAPGARERFLESLRILEDARTIAPDNPRLLWVSGANQWYASPERGGGHDVAIATYARGLEIARQQRSRRQRGGATDPLEPSWGEPELLMNLAWANLNRTDADGKVSDENLAAAERYAADALALVPYWRYVRGVLMVQIREARARAAGKNPAIASTTGSKPS